MACVPCWIYFSCWRDDDRTIDSLSFLVIEMTQLFLLLLHTIKKDHDNNSFPTNCGFVQFSTYILNFLSHLLRNELRNYGSIVIVWCTKASLDRMFRYFNSSNFITEGLSKGTIHLSSAKNNNHNLPLFCRRFRSLFCSCSCTAVLVSPSAFAPFLLSRLLLRLGAVGKKCETVIESYYKDQQWHGHVIKSRTWCQIYWWPQILGWCGEIKTASSYEEAPPATDGAVAYNF